MTSQGNNSKSTDVDQSFELKRLAKFNDSTFDPRQIIFKGEKIIISYGEFGYTNEKDVHELNGDILSNYGKDNLLKIALIVNNIIEYDKEMKDYVSMYNTELENNERFKAVINNILREIKSTELDLSKTVEYKKTEITDEKTIISSNKEGLLKLITDSICRLYSLSKHLSKIMNDHCELVDENNGFRNCLYTVNDYERLSQH